MLFNSTEFLFLFLPVVLVVFVFLARTGNTEAQITWLIFASILFYGNWNAVFVLLIIFSIVVNFTLGRLISVGKDRARTWLILGVIFNLGLLGYFKYANFFVDNLNALGLWIIPLPNIFLPLAISFFTFQQIAYLVDVTRGECKEYKFRHYALFVMFFPQLIAGPIVHHREMMPQFEKLRSRKDLWSDITVGLTILAIGLFKKVVLADSLAQYADPLFSAAADGKPINSVDSWIATLSFSFQIYFDFSGYSDMAIGSARLFGIRLPENFRSPYKSLSMLEVWDRWHMTLSRFLRDYLYITLGGNRHGSTRRYINLFTTFLLGGLWHGAAWTYVIWGGLHGLYLCVNHAWRAFGEKLGIRKQLSSPFLTPFYIFVTFMAWSLAAVVFRAPDMQTAIALIIPGFAQFSMEAPALLNAAILASSISQILASLGLESAGYFIVYGLLGICAFVCWMLPNTQQYMQRYEPVIDAEYPTAKGLSGIQWQPRILHACILGLLIGAGLLSMSSITEFFYFQF